MFEKLIKKIQKIWDEARRNTIQENIERIFNDDNLRANLNIDVPGVRNGSHPIDVRVLPGDLLQVVNDDYTGFIIHLSKINLTVMKKEEDKEDV